jgi:hypothetical protein
MGRGRGSTATGVVQGDLLHIHGRSLGCVGGKICHAL